MRAISASTTVSDPYRAGVELGEALEPIDPEVVFLFASIDYGKQGAELLGGLHDVLGRAEVFGCTGDGFYERNQVGHVGVSALGLNSGGAVRWVSAEASGVRADPQGCVQAALAELEKAAGGEQARLLLLSSDFHTDSTEIERALSELPMPVVGGLAGDDYRMAQCFQFRNQRVLTDSIVLLGACGRLAFDIQVGNTLPKIGSRGVVTQVSGTLIQTIDGMPAMDFVMRETGKPVLQTDRGVVALVVVDPDRPWHRRIRSVLPALDVAGGSLGFFGGIEAGQSVQACLASPEELLAEVYAIAARARSRIEPRAALIVSCAGRKELLGSQIGHEISALAKSFPEGLPLAGYPSFGEFGPLRDEAGNYSASLFHNMTYVVLLLGDGA